MEEVFQKEWLFVGMTSEIPKKGDYLTVEIGAKSCFSGAGCRRQHQRLS